MLRERKRERGYAAPILDTPKHSIYTTSDTTCSQQNFSLMDLLPALMLKGVTAYPVGASTCQSSILLTPWKPKATPGDTAEAQVVPPFDTGGDDMVLHSDSIVAKVVTPWGDGGTLGRRTYPSPLEWFRSNSSSARHGPCDYLQPWPHTRSGSTSL